ncbi:hypothetical protein D046_2773B, partial [Vibrio parahaemolyticus V-223/04]
AYKILI